MPTLTLSLEDTSPLLVYSSNSTSSQWSAGSSQGDPFLDQYSDGTFTLTQVNGANASFAFFGTGVQIYGAKRSNHGLYQVIIDSLVYPAVNGAEPVSPVFQTALFSTIALHPGYHTVTIANEQALFLDVDFIMYQTPIGLDNETLLVTTFQDGDTPFSYSPALQWSSTPSNIGMFSAGSGHVTTSGGAYADITFEGDAIALYGPVGPTGSPYSVQLDSSTPSNYSAYKSVYRAQQMLFQASNLGGGQHSVRVQSQAPDNSALSLGIDYAQVFTAPSLQRSSHAVLSVGAVIGIVVGAVAALILLLFSINLWRRRRTKEPAYKLVNGFTGISAVDILTPEALPEARSSTQHLIPPPHLSMGMTTQATHSMYASIEDPDQMVQVLTIPFTSDGKYRPDLASAPQLSPPPPGARRATRTGDGQRVTSPSPHAGMQNQQIPRQTNRQGAQNTSRVVPGNPDIPPPQYQI
ncbi:hypothetical protein HYPSUDRAFT_43686 [Hypholoma sublateritium FD-334 SS-4]|uniref:Transmembrane protein n=1 Tax=Hypholoma sublateritium (strain FD-334 SS-4) TaxID=945553 RepID=A0A0D2L005_HYPSF|nr:hypothetical protein HYPSUDRAFT_43686 [Hypholoma sublateritium FD-334 SS-4]